MKKILLIFLLAACKQSAWSQIIPVDIFGVYYYGGKEMFARGDISSNIIFDISQIYGVSGVTSGYFDRTTNKYILGSNLGILVIDANTGQVLDTINSQMGGVVYNAVTNDLYGVLWNGSQEKFARIDLDSEIVDTMATIPGVTGAVSGSGYLDERNGYYIIKTNIGLVVINIHTGNVVKSFNPAVNIKNVVYDAATNDVYGVFWNGSQEKFARIDLDSQQVDSSAVLAGVVGVSSAGSGYDPETGYYVVRTNLGVLVIDKNTGTLLATLSTPAMKYLIFPTIRKRICPLPVVPSFSFNLSGLTLNLNATVSHGTIVYWNFGDGNHDTTTSSSISLTHTYSHADTFRICMTTKDSCGYSISYCDSVVILTTGIYQKNGINFSVYPTPFKGNITIRYPVPAINHRLSICNMLGEVIISTALNGTQTDLDLSGITSTGVYFLRITDNTGEIIYSSKLIRD